MFSWPVVRLALQHFGSFLIRHWRIVALVVLALLVALYVRSAEQAKRDLADVKVRAEIADSIIATRAAESARLTGEIETLKDSAATADSAYRAALARARRPRPSTPVLVPANPADTTRESHDTSSVLDDPEVQDLLGLCESRVITRDAIILRQDLRHREDSLTIAELRNTRIPPILYPKPPSKLARVATMATVGAAASLASHYASGGKGDPTTPVLIGTSVGALLGLFR